MVDDARDGLRDGSARRSATKAMLFVGVIAFLAFLPTVNGDFVFDDVPLISQNEWVQSWRWMGRAFTTHFWDVSLYSEAREFRGTDEVVRQYYRPLVTATYVINWMLGGGKPWLFHLTNTILHAIAAALAARVAMRWTRSVRLGFACGVIFAIHPTRTECVTWISGRTDVMMLLFVLAALECFAAFERRRAEAAPRAWLFFGLALASLVCGLASKEPAVMFPLLALADRAVRAPKDRSWLVSGVTGALCGTYLLARALFWMPEGHVEHSLTPAHFLVTVGAYVKRIILPWPPTMYYFALHSDASGKPVYPPALLAFGAVCVIATIVALFVAWRRDRVAFWLLVAAGAFLGPLLNVYFTGMNVSAQDRFIYAPLFLLVTGVGVLFRQRAERLSAQRLAPFVFGAVALAAAIVVQIRTLDFRSNAAFWKSELEQNPDHPYGLEMLAVDAAQNGDLEEAYGYFTRMDGPQAKRYRLAGGAVFARSHFQRAAVLAALLPDGRADDLAAILDEMWRLVDRSFVPPRTTVADFDVGAPITIPEGQHEALEKFFLWDMALIATRIGDTKRTELALARASPSLLLVAPNPSNGILALARAGRYADAKKVRAALGERIEQGKPTPAGRADLAALAKQIDEAERMQTARNRAASDAERANADALRLAGLGAYFAGLRALYDAGLFTTPDAGPLVTQLLVACRLDDAARAHAGAQLGPDRAAAVVAELTAQLPPRVRDASPVKARFEDVLARVIGRSPK